MKFDVSIKSYETELIEFGLVSLEDNDKTGIFLLTDVCIENHDPVHVLKEVKEILSSLNANIDTQQNYYQKLMSAILEVSTPYSSFVEVLLCNMFITDNDVNWRNDKKGKISNKLGDKTLAKRLKLQSLLYQQNKKSIESVEKLDEYIDDPDLTIHEKIFLEQYQNFD